MGSRPDGWWRDRPGAVRRLVGQLGSLDRELIVVFDGPRPDGLQAPAGVDVRFARRRGRDAADDDIVELVAADPTPYRLLVVTSDAELARRVRELGAEVAGARWLLDRVRPSSRP